MTIENRFDLPLLQRSGRLRLLSGYQQLIRAIFDINPTSHRVKLCFFFNLSSNDSLGKTDTVRVSVEYALIGDVVAFKIDGPVDAA